jgi:hypothetical protein
VIDRLLKNQNPLDNRNNLRSSSPHPGPGQTSGEPRRNFAGNGFGQARTPSTVAGPLRAAWFRPKQTDLIPDKGQFRSRFRHPLGYCCPTTIFLDPRNRHRHHLSATLLDGRAGKAVPGAVAIARAAVSECWL